jgi:hemoglobin/transferrin/lactoferrin receptor protein
MRVTCIIKMIVATDSATHSYYQGESLLNRHVLRTVVTPFLLAPLMAAPVCAGEPAGELAGELAGDLIGAAPPSETITVSATRAPIALLESPVTVTVLTAEDMREQLVEDIRDLVRFEPGVSVRRAPARFGAAIGATGRDGNSGFNIRGLEGNRVLIQVDGIRVPETFGFGAQVTTRDYVDLGLVKSVEIVRGAASALYGSDGLAGAVSFTTADPADLLVGNDRLALVGRGAFDSAENQWTANGAAAARFGSVSVLAGYTFRKGHELENQGSSEAPDSTRTAPNPQDRRSDALLGKLVWDAGAGHRLRATAEWNAARTDTDVLSGRTPNATASTSVIDLDAKDETSRVRASLDWTWTTGGLLEELFAVGYWQSGTDLQETVEDRRTAPDRTRINTFDNEVYGLAATARLGFMTGRAAHRLVVGADWSRTQQEGLRDGTVPTPPDVFPTRAFPPTDFDLVGVFAADEIRLFDGRLILFPGLRFDWYDLRPAADPLSPAADVTENSDSQLSPKFGVTWKVAEGASLVFNYAEGFRAPSPGQVNQFFDNPGSPFFAYRSLPNPDLGPERSRTFEGGLRFEEGPASGQVTAFIGRYQDFISQEVVGGTGTIADPVLFQFINLDEVDIHGLEMRAAVDLKRGFGLDFAFAYAKGSSQGAGGTRIPLLTINPIEFVAGLSWASADDRFGASLIGTLTGGKERRETEGLCTPSCLLSDSFAVLDMTAFARLSPRATVRVGLFNLTDAAYVEWPTIRGLADTAANRAVLDAFTSPGRNVTVSLTLGF